MSEERLDLDKEITRVRSYAERLAKLTIDMLPQVKFNEHDHLTFMEASVVVRQLDHLRSVLILVDSKQYQDAFAIARIMLEGLVLLLWVKENPVERSLNWRAYVWIEQFRESHGEHNAEMDGALDTYCRKYLKEESKDKPQKDIGPDDYLTGWRREDNDKGKFVTMQLKTIFEKVGFGKLHEGVYSPASGWVHWDSTGMAKCIKRGPDGAIIYGGADMRYIGGMATTSALHALFASVAVLDGDRNLGFAPRLEELYKKYIAKEELIA
jgi:hypothetical protein